jgi:hypothetical protein
MERFFGRLEVTVIDALGVIAESEVSFSWIGEGVEEEEEGVPVVVMESAALEDTGCACSMPKVRTIA